MPATSLPSYTRYFPPGTRKYYWLTSVANPAAPTRAELNAGTDLSGQVAAVSGFALQRARVDVTPMGSQVVVMLDTITDASGETSEIVVYAAADSNDTRLIMPAGTAGFLVFLNEGDTSGRRCEVWPVTVNAMIVEPDTETPGEIRHQFTVTAAPVQNALVP